MAKEEILIRVVNTETQKVKNVFPAIANNKALMKNMGFIIQDPQYEAKMEAVNNKKPFVEKPKAPVATPADPNSKTTDKK